MTPIVGRLSRWHPLGTLRPQPRLRYFRNRGFYISPQLEPERGAPDIFRRLGSVSNLRVEDCLRPIAVTCVGLFSPIMSDILILGATGFTGKLIARYLANHPQRPSSPFTLALGGRSRDKLKEVAISLGSTTNSDSIVVVNLLDYSNVESAVVRAKVVINAIGPYWKFGDNIVRCVGCLLFLRTIFNTLLHTDRACAKHGIHYVDITPEPHFVAHIMEKCVFVPLQFRLAQQRKL